MGFTFNVAECTPLTLSTRGEGRPVAGLFPDGVIAESLKGCLPSYFTPP